LLATDANPEATYMIAGSKDNKLIGFKVKAQNDNVRLYNLVLTSSSALDIASNYRLTNAS
jgi:hypothetical protein